MPPTNIIETVKVVTPVYALTSLFLHVNTASQKVVSELMNAEIKNPNTHHTRQVFCESHEFNDGVSAYADTDICISFYAHVVTDERRGVGSCEDEHLLMELFEDEQTTILDYNVLPGRDFDYHVGLEFKDGSASIVRIPRLKPEDLHKYRFVRVAMVQ